MEGHADNCVETYCDLAGKNLSALKLAETSCMDEHQSSPADFDCTGELAPICGEIVFDCLYLARIGRPDLL